MTNPTADAAKLLPCPFCGGEAELETVAASLDRTRWSVGCKESLPNGVRTAECMGYQSLTSFATKRKAIAAWNTRRQPAPGCDVHERNTQEASGTAREAPSTSRDAAASVASGGIQSAPPPSTQPAPPEGEPDFMGETLDLLIRNGMAAAECMQPLCRDIVSLVECMYRLGLSARPKIEDAEMVLIVKECRANAADPRGNPYWPSQTFEKAADLLERLAGDFGQLQAALELANEHLKIEPKKAKKKPAMKRRKV